MIGRKGDNWYEYIWEDFALIWGFLLIWSSGFFFARGLEGEEVVVVDIPLAERNL